MVSVWFFGSYRKTKQKWEWMVAPLIMILSFVVGLLSAVVVGVTFSTIIFVGSFYKSGVVKYLANGLTLRSTIERGYRESVWLDQNGDLIQVLVLQNYLFFGNAQSLLAYLTTMFDVSDEESMHFQDLAIPLPPPPLFIIIDFTIVSGIDTSAIDLLREAVTLCKNNHCRLFISGMSHSLRSSVVYAGVKSDATFSFQPDLEAALGKAEDGILDSVFHVKEQTEHDVGVRRRERALSSADFGFRYALDKIDEQHGLNYASELSKLEQYTKVVELKPGESLFQDEGGSVLEEDRGFFFIEDGLMTIERDPSQASRNTMSLRAQYAPEEKTPRMTRVDSIGHLNARAPTRGKEDAKMKQLRRSERGLQNFRLARIGSGWVVGTIEGASGLKNSGVHVAITECRLHLLPFARVKEIEKTDPGLILSLFKLCSHLSARRQELTIEQLTQYMTIMNSPAHTSQPINRATLASLQRIVTV
jgi:CRP-like cAMP-binding protein